MEPTPLSHDFWLVLAAFVSFSLAASGAPFPWWPKLQAGWVGAALLALALLW